MNKIHLIFLIFTISTISSAEVVTDAENPSAEQPEGLCFLSNQNTFQKVVNQQLVTLSLFEAKMDPKCPNLDSFKKEKTPDIEKAYANFSQVMPTFLPFEKDSFGDFKVMNVSEAEKYCQSRGAHTASVREIALFAKKNGAKGIVSEFMRNPVNNTEIQITTYKQKKVNGRSDFFMYSREGFGAPPELNAYTIISSSTNYILNGDTGAISQFEDKSFRGVPLCVKNN